MATCVYCGKPAGFLRWSHKQCRELHKTAVMKIPEFFVKALESAIEPEKFRALAEEVASTHYVSDVEFRQLAVRGLVATISEAFKEHGLSEHDDKRVAGLCNAFGIAANQLGPAGMRFAKAEVLRNLDDKRLPTKIQVENMPINLEHNESVIWLFNQVTYYTTRSRTRYVGGSSGVSIRVMKGVYYRVGAYHGHPIKTQYLSDEGRGVFVIASHNVYFWSPRKAMKIPAKKIISVVPYSDGLQIMRDGANSAPHIFKLDDPAFAADVIARLNQF
jgi:hypothetical protein